MIKLSDYVIQFFVDRAESELGLKVWIPLEEGIRRMGQWHMAPAEAGIQ
jgi:hypothetical protein